MTILRNTLSALVLFGGNAALLALLLTWASFHTPWSVNWIFPRFSAWQGMQMGSALGALFYSGTGFRDSFAAYALHREGTIGYAEWTAHTWSLFFGALVPWLACWAVGRLGG